MRRGTIVAPRPHRAAARAAARAVAAQQESPNTDAVLIRSLLKMHAEAVGLPVQRHTAGDMDSEDEQDHEGFDRDNIYLSDDSSINSDMYQRSLLQQSPGHKESYPSRKGTKKDGPSFRLMTDDDFEDDDEYESGSETDEDSSETDESGDSDSDSDSDDSGLHPTQKRTTDLRQDSVELPVISCGVSMDMKDLLQFSCSLTDVAAAPSLHVPEWDPARGQRGEKKTYQKKKRRPPITKDGSVVLSDEEDNMLENYNKRIEKNERIAQQLSALSRTRSIIS